MLKPWLLTFCIGTALLLGGAGLFLLPAQPRPRHFETSSSLASAARLERLDILETVRTSSRPRVGALAGDLDARDDIGARFHLEAFRGRPVLFGAFCSCSACVETSRRWNELVWQYPGRFAAAALLAVPRGTALFQFHDAHDIRFPLIPDADHALSAQYPGPGQDYAALGCPRTWVIGPDGRYVYIAPMGRAPTPAILASIRRALGLGKPVRSGPPPPTEKLFHESKSLG